MDLARMHTTTRTRSWLLLVAVVLALAACSSATEPVPALDERSNDVYAVDLPDSWVVVDDTAVAYQLVEPDNDMPMTVRVVVTDRTVPTIEDELAQMRQDLPLLADDAEIVGEEPREVTGATGAVQVTSRATLNAAGTGEELVVRVVDLVARSEEGRVVDLKVMGPDDDFDGALSDAVLASLSLRPDGTAS